MNIQLQIDSLLQRIRDYVDIIHVKGHQDQKNKSKLTWLERLNVRADELANILRSRLQQGNSDSLQVFFPESKAQLYIDDLKQSIIRNSVIALNIHPINNRVYNNTDNKNASIHIQFDILK